MIWFGDRLMVGRSVGRCGGVVHHQVHGFSGEVVGNLIVNNFNR